eukprot:4275642-Prymnesium_polylepis.1
MLQRSRREAETAARRRAACQQLVEAASLVDAGEGNSDDEPNAASEQQHDVGPAELVTGIGLGRGFLAKIEHRLMNAQCVSLLEFISPRSA